MITKVKTKRFAVLFYFIYDSEGKRNKKNAENYNYYVSEIYQAKSIIFTCAIPHTYTQLCVCVYVRVASNMTVLYRQRYAVVDHSLTLIKISH